MLSKRKPKNSVKNLSATLQVEIDPLVNKLEYTNNKDPPSLVYPMYLSLLSFCYQQTSQSIVFTSFLNPAIHTIASAKPHQHLLENPKNFPSSKTLSILWKCVGYVWVQISSQGMTMGEGRRKGYIDFSLRLSSSLSL